MPHARSQHPNAVLTPKHRRKMVDCLLEQGWTVEMTADRVQVDAKTVRKWRDRFLVEGEAGLQDRSSRPHRSPNCTPARLRRRVLQLSSSARRSEPVGGSIPNRISLSRDEAKVALDPAMEDAADAVRAHIEEAARIIVEWLSPNLSDL